MKNAKIEKFLEELQKKGFIVAFCCCGKAIEVIKKARHTYKDLISISFSEYDVSHIDKHKDLFDYIYRDSFSCGCGSESIVISQDGFIRPCPYLPDDYFSIRSNQALCEHINGEFHVSELIQNVSKYYEDKQCAKCRAIDNFVSKEMKVSKIDN